MLFRALYPLFPHQIDWESHSSGVGLHSSSILTMGGIPFALDRMLNYQKR